MKYFLRRLVVDFGPVGVGKRIIVVLSHLLDLVVDFLGGVFLLLELDFLANLLTRFLFPERLQCLRHQLDDVLCGEVGVRRRTPRGSRDPHKGFTRQVVRRWIVFVSRSDAEIRLGYAVSGEVHFVVFQVVEADASAVLAVARTCGRIDGRLFDFVVFVLLGLGGAAFRRGACGVVRELFVFLGVHDFAPSLDVVESHVFFLWIFIYIGFSGIRFYLPLYGRNLFQKERVREIRRRRRLMSRPGLPGRIRVKLGR